MTMGRANKYLTSFSKKILLAKQITKNFPENKSGVVQRIPGLRLLFIRRWSARAGWISTGGRRCATHRLAGGWVAVIADNLAVYDADHFLFI